MAAQDSQTPPPPEVDRALRSRIRVFYQAHVDAKTRRADDLVAEESKDFFFDMSKPRYFGFEIRSIAYSDSFTRAEATVECEEDIMIVGLPRPARAKLPRTSRWKLVDGQWFWYFDPTASRQTPFGIVKPGTREEGAPLALPKGPSPEELLKLVKSDKSVVALSASEPSSEVVVVTNGMPGWVRLRVETPRLTGLEAKLDRDAINQNQQATLTVRYSPKGAAPVEPAVVNVVVEPTGAVLPIRVTFRAPPAPGAGAPR